MPRFSTSTLAAALLTAAALAQAATPQTIDVRLTVPTPVLRGDVDVTVTVTVTKLRPPIPRDVEATAVRLHRTRA